MLTRRSFLTKTAVGLAAPLILPTLRLRGEEAPNNRINVALIGCGARAGYVFLENQTIPGLRVIATVDPFRERRERFARVLNEKYGTDACRAYPHYGDVIGRKDIDAIAVFTPDHWHVPLAWAAAQHGKDMYVEKPLTLALEWAWKLRPMMKNRIFQYGTFQRSMRQFRMASDLVRNGYIGKVSRVDVWCPGLPVDKHVPKRVEDVPADFDYDYWKGPAPLRPYQPERVSNEGGWHCPETSIGFIAGWGAHPLDICQWGLNKDHTGPVHYSGRGDYPAAKEELYSTTRSWDLECTYEDGTKMRFMDLAVASPIVKQYHYVVKDHGTVFHGEKGWVGVDRDGLYSSDNNRLRKVAFSDRDVLLPASPGHWENFLQCMRTREETVCPFESALRSDTISHLSEIVVRTGQPLRWNPATETIVEGTDAQNAFLKRPMREGYTLST